jgi:hypothetical protein
MAVLTEDVDNTVDETRARDAQLHYHNALQVRRTRRLKGSGSRDLGVQGFRV